MNTNKFRIALEIIREDFEKNDLVKTLEGFQNLLQQSISKPSPETAKVFKDEHNRLIGLLNSCKSNDARPTYKKIFNEIGASKKIGTGLQNNISNILNKNNITPANALTEITNLNKEISLFYQNVTSLTDNLESLNIKTKRLKENESEIGISIPPEVIDSNIKGLEKELHKLERVFKTFKEVAGDDASSINIRAISSSNFEIYLVAGVSLATCVAKTLDWLASFYKKFLEIKKLRQDINSQSLPPKIIQPVEDYFDSQVKAELQEMATKLVDEYCKKAEKGRKNELKNAMFAALQHLANRLDHGTIIDVEVGEPDKPQEPDKAKSDDPKETEKINNQHKQVLEEYQKKREEIAEINKKGCSTSFLTEGGHSILSLPEVEIDTTTKDEKKQKTSKKE